MNWYQYARRIHTVEMVSSGCVGFCWYCRRRTARGLWRTTVTNSSDRNAKPDDDIITNRDSNRNITDSTIINGNTNTSQW